MFKEHSEIYEFGNFRLDVGERKIERVDGRSNGSLPEKAFRTLVHMVRRKGTLLEKDELISTVWPDTVVEENNLAKAIYAIRRFLDDMDSNARYIETVPKHGYRFISEVKRIGADGEHGTDSLSARTDLPGRSPAYDLYLRGKVKAGNVRRTETEGAIKLLQQAIAIDPNFAEAHAHLARAYIRMAFNFSDNPERDAFIEDAEVAIEAALSLKPELSEGHFARGLLLWTHSKGFANEQAIKSYKRALRSDPNADEIHHQLSMVYGHVGLLDEALVSVRKAIEINPNNTMARFRVSNYLAWQCRFDEALSSLKSVPSDVGRFLVDRIQAEILVQVGRIEDAESIVDRHLKQNPDDKGGSLMSVKALIFAQRGKTKEAEEAIARSAAVGKGFGHFHHTAYNIASAYAALNELDKAVKWVEAAADDGFPCYTYFARDPNLADLRDHKPFIALMSAMEKQWELFQQLAQTDHQPAVLRVDI